MPAQIEQGTRLTCECCGALFEVIKPCTCEATQDMICSCGTRLISQEQQTQQKD